MTVILSILVINTTVISTSVDRSGHWLPSTVIRNSCADRKENIKISRPSLSPLCVSGCLQWRCTAETYSHDLLTPARAWTCLSAFTWASSYDPCLLFPPLTLCFYFLPDLCLSHLPVSYTLPSIPPSLTSFYIISSSSPILFLSMFKSVWKSYEIWKGIYPLPLPRHLLS